MPEKYITNAANLYDTQKLSKHELNRMLSTRKPDAREVITQVFAALEEKGYNAVNQLTGYILSGDPTYITSYRDARKIIGRVERDELLEELITFYLYDTE